MKSIFRYTKTFIQLLKADFLITRQVVVDDIINSCIWLVCLVVIFAYVFPHLGMQEGFGVFMAVGGITSTIFWTMWTTSNIFIADLEGDKTITYFLTLPIPNHLVFIKTIVSYAIRAMLTAAVILPLSKILLWHKFSLQHFAPLKFMLFFIATSFFVGAFSLLVVSTIKSIQNVGNVSMRFLFPLWFFGGSNFSWKMLHTISPKIATFCLLNPLVYSMEGIRASILGQEEFLPFWTCLGMLVAFTFVFGWWGFARLKKRLDFV